MDTSHLSPSAESVLTFFINDQSFCIDVLKLREIVNVGRISKIPLKHEHILGLSNIRGHNVPVIDLSLALGIKPINKETGFLLVTEIDGETQGFRVDQIGSLKKVSYDDFKQTSIKSDAVSAYVNIDDSLFGIVNFESIIHKIQQT